MCSAIERGVFVGLNRNTGNTPYVAIILAVLTVSLALAFVLAKSRRKASRYL